METHNQMSGWFNGKKGTPKIPLAALMRVQTPMDASLFFIFSFFFKKKKKNPFRFSILKKILSVFRF